MGGVIEKMENLKKSGSSGGATSGHGNGIAETGTSSGNVLLVNNNASGQAQWAQTLTSGSGGAGFRDVALYSSGNIYAAGYSACYGTLGFGNGVTATGTSAGWNVLLLKY